jgi:site-specific DNA-methyltransferase (adenine-specific)
VIRLLTAPNDLVLDCFIGSGTTAVAAIQEGRNYIGIEIIDEYVKLAREACEREQMRKAFTWPEQSEEADNDLLDSENQLLLDL